MPRYRCEPDPAPPVASGPALPFVKTCGGKRKLLPEILPRLAKLRPGPIANYHEPFVGGGAVFFALASDGRIAAAHLADTNPDLVNLYEQVRDGCDQLVATLGSGRGYKNDAESYYRIRARDPEKLSPTARAARFLYINRTCFNGLWRVNKAGKCNVPFGKYDNPTICDEERLRAASRALVGATVSKRDFAASFLRMKSGDVAYADPPYLPLSATSNFTSYTSDGFGLGDHEHLRDAILAAHARGVAVLLSNCPAPAIRALYSGKRFVVDEVSAVRAVNSDGAKRGAVKELLIRCAGRR